MNSTPESNCAAAPADPEGVQVWPESRIRVPGNGRGPKDPPWPPLDNLIPQCSDRQRALFTVTLGYHYRPGRPPGTRLDGRAHVNP